MSANTDSMDDPTDLNETDRAILDLLADGRETRASLADALDKHGNYISNRLKLLRIHGIVRYYHEPSALYELTESGRGQVGGTDE